MAKVRLDKLLVKREFAKTKADAGLLISSGRVLVGGIPNAKLDAQVDPGVDVKLKDEEEGWVSRGAHKLLGAIEAFGIDPQGMVGLDVGASTGGFTDVLLKHGAERVYAVDVGYGQLAWKLRQDKRVVVLDRENIRNLDPQKIGEPIDITVIDASFISLTLILGKVASLMGGSGKPVVALIKPQFEARKDQVGEGGVVRDEAVRQECIDTVSEWVLARGFQIDGIVESPIQGPAGNIEYLILLRTPSPGA